MDEFSNLNFIHYVNLFTDSKDDESLQELYLLKEKCPNFDFSKYKVGLFSLDNIKKMGEVFLLTHYDWLTRSLLELPKEKIYYVEQNRRFIYFDSMALESLSIEELDEMKKYDDDVFYLFCELSKSFKFKKNYRKLLQKIDVVSFVAKNFEDVYSEALRKEVERFILDKNSSTCISILDKRYITSSSSLIKFLKSYSTCKDLVPLIDSENVLKFNDLLFSNHILKLQITNSGDLDNYYELKYQKVINLLNNDVEECKEIISELYFNIKYDVLKKSLETAKKCNMFSRYTRLLELNTKEEIIGFLGEIKDKTNIYYEIEDSLIKVSKKSICESIKPTFKINNGVVLLDGCDFSFLVHSIKGYADRKKASLLSTNPAYWYDCSKEDSYISTSYISNDFMGMNSSISYILGFNDISEEDILYFGLGDIYASRKQVRNNLRNGKSSCVLAEDLRMNPKMIYNEVTLRRMKNGTILNPNFILSLDTIKRSDEEAARYFKVPIYLLDRMKYATRMKDKLDKDLACDDLDAYIGDLRRMFFSFCNECNIFDRFFDTEKLEFETLRIIRKYVDSTDPEVLRKVEEIIYLYDSLIVSYNFYKDDAIEYDKKRYVNMLKK